MAVQSGSWRRLFSERYWGTHRNTEKAKTSFQKVVRHQKKWGNRKIQASVTSQGQSDLGHSTNTTTARSLMPPTMVTATDFPMLSLLLNFQHLHHEDCLYHPFSFTSILLGWMTPDGASYWISLWTAKFCPPPRLKLYGLVDLVFERIVLYLRKIAWGF